MISAARRDDIIGALRRGTVPSAGLDALAVGIDSFAPTLDEELATVETNQIWRVLADFIAASNGADATV